MSWMTRTAFFVPQGAGDPPDPSPDDGRILQGVPLEGRSGFGNELVDAERQTPEPFPARRIPAGAMLHPLDQLDDGIHIFVRFRREAHHEVEPQTHHIIFDEFFNRGKTSSSAVNPLRITSRRRWIRPQVRGRRSPFPFSFRSATRGTLRRSRRREPTATDPLRRCPG